MKKLWSRKKGILLAATGTAVALALGILTMKISSNEVRELRIGFPRAWASLLPSLQSTMFGDAILINSFERLVRLSPIGVMEPYAAKSWDVSDDMRVVTFKIDTSRRFSDGTYLKAHHFKDCWEYGLSLTPDSSNSSLLDALYMVEGVDAYPTTKKISGVVVLDDETLQVKFRKPIRMALEFLGGGRLGVFLRKEDGSILGTGPYVIEKYDQQIVILKKNPYSKADMKFPIVKVKNMNGLDVLHELENGTIDAYYAASSPLPLKNTSKNIKDILGHEFAHHVVSVNGLKDRLFHDGRLRKALQYLLHEWTKTSSELQLSSEIADIKVDAQVFTTFQAGRLDIAEVESIIRHGSLYVGELIEASRAKPIKFVFSSPRFLEMKDYLEEKGLRFTDDSGYDKSVNVFTIYYKTMDADLVSGGFSLSIGDPDGIYHAMGRNGAIVSPMRQRHKTEVLLEEGRSIIDIEQLPAHYQKVSRAILEEVPFFHLGFIHGQVVYNSQTVDTSHRVAQRNLEDFTSFWPNEIKY